MPVAYVKHALHDLILINMTVGRFVGTGSFLIRYYHTKYVHYQLKKLRHYF
jgi:uncharacterized membrane protein